MIGSEQQNVPYCFTTLPAYARKFRTSQRERLANRPHRNDAFRANAPSSSRLVCRSTLAQVSSPVKHLCPIEPSNLDENRDSARRFGEEWRSPAKAAYGRSIPTYVVAKLGKHQTCETGARRRLPI